MSETASLKNQLLIAMPNLQDPNFSRTVTYICEHGEHGAMGIVLNRPTDLRLADVLRHMEIEGGLGAAGEQIVYLGGPVEEERGFVLHSHTAPWSSTLAINDDISITTSRDILEAMARGGGPDLTLVALGYAGWAAGQLEREMQDNAWLSGPADQSILFELPAERRWEAAARLLGVDVNLLSSEAGHA
ncbi:MAG: YqgE/AlgH family protein [Gammaproteobacteria bacterium]|nr:YqgE/AlgH family protein [Gammaproteobacteria bacterium]MCB1797717.1 YqgE/AlgH family protein [Gammaproteobacteria bacterium]